MSRAKDNAMTDAEVKTAFVEQAIPVVERIAEAVEDVPAAVAMIALSAVATACTSALAEFHQAGGVSQDESESAVLCYCSWGEEIADERVVMLTMPKHPV